MKSHIAATRAIAAEYATQFIRPFLWVAIGLFIVAAALIGLVAYQFSVWWLLFGVPILVVGTIGLLAWLLVRFLLNRLSPAITAEQKAATKQFVTKAQGITENVQTPYPIIAFRVVKDAIVHKDTRYIQGIIQDSKDLRPDFEKLRELFK